MATPASVLTAIATAVEAQVSGIVRLGSDYRADLTAIAVGATRYQLRGGPAGQEGGSNVVYTVEAIELEIRHRLADPDAERTYTEGAMQTNIEAFIVPSFWLGITGVFEVVSDPEYDVARVLNVISTQIRVSVSISP